MFAVNRILSCYGAKLSITSSHTIRPFQRGELWGAKPGTPKGDELDVLMLLVEKYEEENYAIPASDPIEAIKFLMEQNSLSRKDLEPYIGASGRVSEVLS